MDVFIDPRLSRYYERFPVVLVDIGARGGLARHWQPAKKHLRVIGFEPDDRSFSQLQTDSESTRYLNIGLSNESATLDFNLTREEGDSSVLKPNREFLDKFPDPGRFDIVGTTKIKTDTLDNQLRQNHISDVDFLKLDTQGSELFILQGATRVLEDAAFGLEIEVEFAQMYQGQPLFSEVDIFVRNFGFDLFDLRPVYWKRTAGKDYGRSKGQIVYGDALYLRDLADFVDGLDQIQDTEARKAKALRALSVCLLYGYLDYALELLDAASELLSATEYQLIDAAIRNETAVSNRIPRFRGRGRITSAVSKLLKWIQPTHEWLRKGSGPELGNLE